MNKALQYVLAIVLIFFAGVVTGWKYSHTLHQLENSIRDNTDLQAQNGAQSHNDAIAKDATATLEKQNVETARQLQAAQANAAAAQSESDRLQQQITELQRRLSESNSAGDSAVAGQRKADAVKYANMLAVVLRSADKRAGELAAIADDSRIRGVACQDAYNAIREKYQ